MDAVLPSASLLPKLHRDAAGAPQPLGPPIYGPKMIYQISILIKRCFCHCLLRSLMAHLAVRLIISSVGRSGGAALWSGAVCAESGFRGYSCGKSHSTTGLLVCLMVELRIADRIRSSDWGLAIEIPSLKFIIEVLHPKCSCTEVLW